MLKEFEAKSNCLVGVISDTHGVLPRSAALAFKDAELIVHAGDIGQAEILSSLEEIAPTIGVRGNMDVGPWAENLAEQEFLKISQSTVCVAHDLARLDLASVDSLCHAVISGHTHRPLVARQNGVLHINPGSAVQPRSGYPPSVALLFIEGHSINVRLIELQEY